jgi:two-component system alkaline phosphatase synthesis response regulator PhoP
MQAAMSKSMILIADDNPTNVELLQAYLSDMDCDTAIAVDGRDTLDKVAQLQPDLILLDIMMPKLSGFEVCKLIKEDPDTRNIMVLMVTALNELGDIERAVAAGCDDFLSKPVNKLELLKRVENMPTGRRGGVSSPRWAGRLPPACLVRRPLPTLPARSP